MRKILGLLGLAKKAGRVEIGEEPVSAAARAKQARLILVASDAAENSARRAGRFAETTATAWAVIPATKAELGGSLGRTACAMVALTDAGFAAAVAKALAQLDAERYGELAKTLEVKAERVVQRKREKRRHEKNMRSGKYKPKAPPPKQSSKPAQKPQQPLPRAKLPRGVIKIKRSEKP